MNFAQIRQKIKPWMLPIAMLGGILFHNALAKIAFITPYLIFTMLCITFCKVKPSEFKLTRLSWFLLIVQIGGALGAYYAIAPFNTIVAQGIMICFLCPTASAAPVVTGMLGGSVARVTTFSVISNIAVALLAPLLFSKYGVPTSGSSTLVEAQLSILQRVAPLLIIPLIIAYLLRKIAPKVANTIATHQGISFYLWAIALFIVVGRAISFVISEPSDEIPTMIALAVGAAIACCIQFWAGRKIGYLCGDKVAGAQGLGQKNTILAIWLALTWLHPLASVGPAAYIAWQNIINSAQLYKATKHNSNIK